MAEVYRVPRAMTCEHCGSGAVVSLVCSTCGKRQLTVIRAAKRRREVAAKRATCEHEWESEGVRYPAGQGTETQLCVRCGERRYLDVAS